MIRKLCVLILSAIVLCNLTVVTQATVQETDAGGINILKTNASGQPLSGAVFRIAREATKDEQKNLNWAGDTLKLGETEIMVVYQSFYADRGMSGKLFQQVSTDTDGKAAMYGLPHGTYYLVEVKAPAGYNRITVPIRVTVNKYSHLTVSDDFRDDENQIIDNTIHIINLRYHLPDTGNTMQRQLVFAGAGIVCSAAALILLNRRRLW